MHNQCKVTSGTTVYVQSLFVAPNDIHINCNMIHTMYHNTQLYHNTQYCNTPQDCNKHDAE